MLKQNILGENESNHKIVFNEDGGCTLTPLQVMAVRQLLRRIPGLNGGLHSALSLTSENEKLKKGVKNLLLSSVEEVNKYAEVLSELFEEE